MRPNIKDYDSREAFIRDLNIWHHDKFIKQNEFIRLKPTTIDYSSELVELKNKLELIKSTWNDQSIATIRKHVEKNGNKQSIDIMIGQDNDKVKAGLDINKSMYHVQEVDSDSIWYKIAQQYPFENPLVRLHVQFPGDVTQWHTDIFAPYHTLLPQTANMPIEEIGKDIGIRRILIAIEDWDWGHCFMFGANIWHQWKAGETIYWNYGVPHCAANMGFASRISLSITGLLNKDIKNYII